MVRKCGRGIAEIAFMEVGVRTRSRAALAKEVRSSTTAKRKKVKQLAKLSSKTTSFVELGDSRIISPERSAGAQKNPSSDFDHEAQVSCCSSNYGSSEIAEDNNRHKRDDYDGQERTEENREEEDDVFVDLKDDESNEVETSTYNSCREREMTPSSNLREESDGVESTSKPTVVNSNGRSSTLAEEMPSESELEEFFAAAEKDIQKRFAEKYNFDIVKDTPLEGRYEWVRLKP